MDSRAVLCAVRIASCTDEGREEITTRDALLSGACGHCAGRSYPAQYPVVYNVVDSTRVLAAAVAYVAWSALHCSFERPRLEPHCHLTHVHVSIVTLFVICGLENGFRACSHDCDIHTTTTPGFSYACGHMNTARAWPCTTVRLMEATLFPSTCKRAGMVSRSLVERRRSLRGFMPAGRSRWGSWAPLSRSKQGA